ncbi:MAG: peptidylprolyl isomerase [Crocinitomicaceae bacterium]|jgi:peptidyl-prolyl cis-trans isomerase SurA
MIKYFTLLTILLFCKLIHAQQTKSIDKIVAYIGDQIILKSDIENTKIQGLQDNSKVINDCEILDLLIMQKLLLNQAELDSIKISDAQVDSDMENRLRIIENQIGSKQKLEEFYGKTTTQIKIEMKQAIKNKLLSEEMQRSITSSIQVTPKDIEEYFKNLPKDSIPYINTKLSFQQIVVFPKITQEDKEITFKKLNEIRESILIGKSFDSQARLHSQDPGSAAQGGIISASRGMMVPQFEATVYNLKPGEISKIIETDYGYHIIQLVERKGDDYTCKHILMIPEFNRESLNLASIKMEECYSKLKENQITWDEAVKTYSNDNNTKNNYGIITNPITGEQTWSSEDLNQIDQQIYLLTSSLNKGELTKPTLYFDFYERKQGIRIVRLMDRLPQHIANLNDDYVLIQRATENNKKQSVLKKWVTSKISNNYIQIDSDYKDCSFMFPWKKS